MKRDADGKLTSVTILKLKLHLDAEQSDELQRMAEMCRKGRNAGATNWLLRQYGLPESAKQSERLCKHAKHAGKPKGESSRIYHAVREGSPGLTGTVHSMLANQINSYLAGKLDWREGKTEDGKRPRRKDAILSYDARPPFFTAIEIPVRANEARFSFGDTAELSFRVLSSCHTLVHISLSRLSRGQKTLLHELAAGTRKLADSKVIKRDDEWFWFLPIAFESNAVQSYKEAVLSPVVPDESTIGNADRPFSLVLPERDKPWHIGDSRYITAQSRRIEIMRKAVGWRYRQRNGAGHGRKKVDEKMRRIGQLSSNISDEFRRRIICDIANQCERAGCGVLVYREPSLPLREKCWFARNGLEFNWTRLYGDLENSLARRGIVLRKELLRLKDISNAA